MMILTLIIPQEFDSVTLQNTVVFVGLFFALVAGHWFPWHIIPAWVDERKQLKRTVAYVYGVSCIIIAFSALAVFNDFSDEAVVALIACAAVAGLGTLAPRLVWTLLDKTADHNG